MAGKKTLYDPLNFPLLAEGYARNGLNDIQIAKNLGIKKTAYYDYQKEHPEFAEAIKRGRKPVDIEVENALLKRALGYDYEEKITEVELDATGQPKPSKIKTIKKHVPGEVGAMAFWLKNRKKSEWKDRHSHEVGGEDGKPIGIKGDVQIDLSGLEEKALESILKVFDNSSNE